MIGMCMNGRAGSAFYWGAKHCRLKQPGLTWQT